MKVLTCHGNKVKEGELIRPFRVIGKQAQSVSFWYTTAMPKLSGKAGAATTRGDALRRVDVFVKLAIAEIIGMEKWG